MTPNDKVLKALETIDEMIVSIQLSSSANTNDQHDIEKQTLAELLGRLEVDVRGHRPQLKGIEMSVADTLKRWPDMRIIMPASSPGEILLCYFNKQNKVVEEVAFKVNIENEETDAFSKISLDQRTSNSNETPQYMSELSGNMRRQPISIPAFFQSFFTITKIEASQSDTSNTNDEVDATLTSIKERLSQITNENIQSLANFDIVISHLPKDQAQPEITVTEKHQTIMILPSTRPNEIAICFYNEKKEAPSWLTFKCKQIMTALDVFFENIVKHVKSAQSQKTNGLISWFKKLLNKA